VRPRLSTARGTLNPCAIRNVVVVLKWKLCGLKLTGALRLLACRYPEFRQLSKQGLLFHRHFLKWHLILIQGMFATMAVFPNLTRVRISECRTEGGNQFSGLLSFLAHGVFQRFYVNNGDFGPGTISAEFFAIQA